MPSDIHLKINTTADTAGLDERYTRSVARLAAGARALPYEQRSALIDQVEGALRPE